MSENGEDCNVCLSNEAAGRRETVVIDGKIPKTPLTDGKATKEHDDRVFPAGEMGAAPTMYQPRPPSLPKLTKFGKSVSLEDTVRTRRLKNSQESLSDRADTGSSTDSLKEDHVASRGRALSSVSSGRNDLDFSVRPLSAASTGSPVFQDRENSPSECERRPHSQQSDPGDRRGKSTKGRLSPVQPTGPLPPLDKRLVSAPLRAANRIDRDCLDYGVLAKEKFGERIHRNLSDSRLLENMGSDSASVNSIRSIYSVLSPIRPQDVRNRYSRFSTGT